MKKITYWLFSFAVAGLVLFASIASASACWVGHYQPQVPKSLQK